MRISRTDGDDVTVVILGGGRGTRLDPLTRLRSKPAVPLAGKYRLIDVPISNAVHSGMERIFILTQFNSVSLHRHIVTTYRFDPFSHGFVEVLAAQQTPGDTSWFQGTADAVRQNLRFIAEQPGDLVLILSGDHVYRMDYRLLVESHRASNADITLAVLPSSEADISGFGAVRVDDSGRIVEFREKPATASQREGMRAPAHLLEKCGVGDDRPYLASMGVYLFDLGVLRESLKSSAIDFGRDVLTAAVKSSRLQAHFFDGYWRDIGTIRSFFDAHMDLVGESAQFDFHDPDWTIYTHPRYLPGARLHRATFDHSLLADVGIVKDSTIVDSVIGVRSVIRGAEIHRSLIMGVDEDIPEAPPGAPPVGIGPGSEIRNAIVDKNARIGRNVRILNSAGAEEAEGEGWVIRDGLVVVPKNAIIPDGTVI